MNEKGCRHWGGAPARFKCAIGIDWKKTPGNTRACIGNEPLQCNGFKPHSPEEIAEKKQRIENDMNEAGTLLRSGKSPCCGAEINEKHVIKEGRHKGHGPRYCSKCGKCVFFV